MLNQVVHRRFGSVVSKFQIELLIVLIAGLLFAPLMIWGRAVVSGMAVFAFLVGYYYVDKYFWFENGIWAYLAVPYVEVLSMSCHCDVEVMSMLCRSDIKVMSL